MKKGANGTLENFEYELQTGERPRQGGEGKSCVSSGGIRSVPLSTASQIRNQFAHQNEMFNLAKQLNRRDFKCEPLQSRLDKVNSRLNPESGAKSASLKEVEKQTRLNCETSCLACQVFFPVCNGGKKVNILAIIFMHFEPNPKSMKSTDVNLADHAHLCVLYWWTNSEVWRHEPFKAFFHVMVSKKA